MKTLFLISVLASGIYVGAINLPEPIKADAKSYAAALNIPFLNSKEIIPSLRVQAEPLKKKIIPVSSAKSREALLDALDMKLDAIEDAAASPNAAAKQEALSAIKDAAAIVEQLKTKDQNTGIVATTIERITNAVLLSPEKNTCPSP